MRISDHPECLRSDGRSVCIAIGMFDGVHLGHQQVVRQTVGDAEAHEAQAVVLTFDRHPNAVVAPSRTPALIYSLPQKLRAISALEVDATLVVHFDEKFSQQTGEEFVRELVRGLVSVKSVCVGAAFTFGHQRSGNVELLRRLGDELGFRVHGLAAVSLDGQIVSSTRVRESIRAGELDSASQMLGRHYSLAGQVIPGDRIGRQLGFPTANIDVTDRVLPPHGVYAVHAHVLGRSFRAVLNIGSRPTLGHPRAQVTVEAHLLQFEGDLYGQELEITFTARLREEQKFPSEGALRTQILQDIQAAERLFASSRNQPGSM